MADRKITDLTALAAGSQATSDLLTIVDVSEGAAADKNKKITVESLFKGIPSNVGIGTSSPAGDLQISGSGDRSFLITGGTSGTTSVQMGDSSDADAGAILYDNSNNSMQFKTNASERLRIDSSGRLLVGTSTSQGNKSLQIEGDAASADNPGSILLRRGLTSAEIGSVVGRDLGEISFGTQDGDIGALILAESDGTMSSGDSPARLVFSTTADGANSPTERMRIQADGTVKIGTGTGNPILMLNASTSGTSVIQMGDSADNNIGQIHYANSDDSMRFFANNSERMRIDSSGRLGIGTSSPTSKFDVEIATNTGINFTNISTAPIIDFKANSVESAGRIRVNEASGGGVMQFATKTTGGTITEAMRIDSSGRLMVGTTSPGPTAGKQLTIADSANAGITIRSGTNAGGAILFEDDTADRGEIQYSHNGDYMRFKTAGTERMRISSSGTIFLGTSNSTHNTIANTSQTAKLELSGGGGGCGVIELYGGSHGSNSKEIHMHTNSEHRVKVSQAGQFTIHPDSYGFGVRSQNVSNSTIEAFFVAHSSTNHNNGTIVYANYLNGNVVNANNSYGQLSDERLKENIIDAPSQWDDIKSLRVRKYNFREDTGYETHTQIGLVAQEAETVCPGLVQENSVNEGDVVLDGDGNQLESTKRVISSVLYMKAVKALQEAQTRIETLESQHADLLTRVTALEAQ